MSVGVSMSLVLRRHGARSRLIGTRPQGGTAASAAEGGIGVWIHAGPMESRPPEAVERRRDGALTPSHRGGGAPQLRGPRE